MAVNTSYRTLSPSKVPDMSSSSPFTSGLPLIPAPLTSGRAAQRGHKNPPIPAEGTEPTADLSALLIAVGGGDDQAFEKLYRHTRGRVYGLVHRVLVDAEMSAEVTQEVFLALWRSDAALYDPVKGSHMSWLMTLAHRKAVDRVRVEQTRHVRDFRWGIRHQDIDYDQVFEKVINNEEAASVRACLKILSPAQREAIHLAYYTGLTYVDVAHRLGIPVPTAKTRIRDGLKKLSACMTGQGHD